LYLRRVRRGRGFRYILRESYRVGDAYRHRDLMDLGTNPEEYIVYPGGNGFYFRFEVEESLRDQGIEYSSRDLDEAFLPFLPLHIRRVLGMFDHGTGGARTKKLERTEDLRQLQEKLHPFDKRRLHYLRFGQMEIGGSQDQWFKFLHVLFRKSRDEIEHILEGMEQRLRPTELRNYLYAALELAAYFPHHRMRHYPGALDQEKVDECFLEELCRLNGDPSYLLGADSPGGEPLHPYLVRYLILYFDSGDWAANPYWQYAQQFARGRFSRSRPFRAELAPREACRVFGVSYETFQAMTRKELIRDYRRKAKESHPDRGGNHEVFVKLAEAFRCLLANKP